MNIKRIILAALAMLAGRVGGLAEQSLPFEFRNGLVWVTVASHGSSMNFVLDSGAGSSVISLDAARRLGLTLGAKLQVQTVGAPAAAYKISDFQAMVGSIPIKSDLLAISLRAASAACCRPIDGLLGQDFFRGRIVEINYRTHRLRFLDQPDSSRATAVLPIRRHNDAFCVPVAVNGSKPEWTRLDTGCDSALEWSGSILGGTSKGAPSLALASGGGHSVIATVQLGEERISGVKTGVHSRPIFNGEAGLLGSGLLSRYCVTIDARHMRLYLAK